MFNVITNSKVNKEPLNLHDAIDLCKSFIYVSEKDIEKINIDFKSDKKVSSIIYGFSKVNIERV
jgi:hypothetical protein